MIEWIEVADSKRISHEAYSPEEEKIFVRFHDGVEWWYGACPPEVWEQFTVSSRGGYINSVLNHKPHGRLG